VLLFVTLRSRMGEKHALLAALLFGFTTPVWTISANGMWPHTLTVFGILGMAWAADRERWWLVGLFGGVALWGRLHVAVVCAVLGLLVALWRRKPGIAVSSGLTSGAMLGLMTAWTRWMYGTWDPTAAYRVDAFTGYAEQNRLDLVNHLGFWVSPDRGILIWTPLVVVLLAALVRNWRDLPDWSGALVLAGIAYTLLQGTFNRFSGGDTFYGYRLGLEIIACLAPAMALSAHRMGKLARRSFVPVAIVQFAMIFPGATSNAYFTTADEVWRRNTIVVALMSEPLVFGTAFVGSLAVGVLLARIWANPALERRRERREPRQFSRSASQ
jgi:alpha-1,2-mannosyltransferase